MIRASRASTALDACRAEYVRLDRELHHRGLDEQAIRATRESLSESHDGRFVLKAEAYDPTGVALGRPLPERGQTVLLTRLACLIEAWLADRTRSREPTLTHVPATAYHITVLNRSHYEFSSITLLTPGEQRRIEATVSQLGLKAIDVIACGIGLTASGRLFVKCLPADDRLFELRARLAEAFPQMRINAPRTAHIKIGHLRTPLRRDQLLAFGAWLKRLDERVTRRVVFGDVYTPQGRIRL
jgi:hypothetical protein